MDIILLCVLAGAILIFILIFWKRSQSNVSKILAGNTNVAPLFLEKSAKIKFETICANFRPDHSVNIDAKRLQKDYNEGKITLEAYNDSLEQLLKDNV